MSEKLDFPYVISHFSFAIELFMLSKQVAKIMKNDK